MQKNPGISLQSPEALLSDLQALVAEAERMAEGSAGEDNAAENLRDHLEAARERLSELHAVAKRSIAAGAKGTDQMIRANPYQSMAMALGAGLLLGAIIARRK
jgi:ElaB/YqjD/DUF883 family membrane-anchored ribosome-binding protein